MPAIVAPRVCSCAPMGQATSAANAAQRRVRLGMKASRWSSIAYSRQWRAKTPASIGPTTSEEPPFAQTGRAWRRTFPCGRMSTRSGAPRSPQVHQFRGVHMRSTVFGLLLGSLCLAACSDTTNGVVVHLPEATPFALRTVNGQALPARIVDSLNPQLRREVVSGAFSINANRTFSRITRFRETRGLVVVVRVVACSGSFSGGGSNFTFVDAGGSLECDRVFSGVVAGDVLSTTLRGFSAIYSR